VFFFFSSRRRHTRSYGDWSSDVCSSDLPGGPVGLGDELGVDQEDPGPGGEAIPGAVLGLEALGDVGRVCGPERREQALLLQAEEIGRASCRERVESAVGAGACKKEEEAR